MKISRCLAGLFLFFVCWANAVPASAHQKLNVTVSIAPQQYFLEKIGADLVDITVMLPPGASPHSYEPKPQQMVALASSGIYFAIGVPFEDVWLAKFSTINKKMLVVHTEAGIKRRSMMTHAKLTEGYEEHRSMTHAETDQTDCAGNDPHVWLSPPLVMLQARNILTGLLTVDPGHKDIYESNYRNFILELVDLDQKIRDIMRKTEGNRKFMIFHPAWGYFADAYGLEQIPVEIEGKEPKAKNLEQLITFARKSDIRVLFVQPQFSSKTAQTIADEIGGRIVFADPLALDWQKNLLEVASEIAAGAR